MTFKRFAWVFLTAQLMFAATLVQYMAQAFLIGFGTGVLPQKLSRLAMDFRAGH